VAATLVGSGLGKSSLAQSAVQLMAALAVINVVVWLLWRRFKKAES
jgi:flagellar biogenesis protein FliO